MQSDALRPLPPRRSEQTNQQGFSSSAHTPRNPIITFFAHGFNSSYSIKRLRHSGYNQPTLFFFNPYVFGMRNEFYFVGDQNDIEFRASAEAQFLPN